MRNEVYNCDCMDFLKKCPDKEFDLAIVDPPYGGGGATMGREIPQREVWSQKKNGSADRRNLGEKIPTRGNRTNHAFGGIFGKYNVVSRGGVDIREWDFAPSPEYFEELFRVSRNQIIWGGNYFDLPPTRCFICWRKTQIPTAGFSLSPIEFAWTSFDRNALYCEFNSAGTPANPRFHPTQKPVALYDWILRNFAKAGDKILDTHVGSGSIRISCHKAGFDFVGCEISEYYFEKQEERFAAETAQGELFEFVGGKVKE